MSEARFWNGFIETGIGADGMPTYAEAVMVTVVTEDRLTSVDYLADEEHRERFPVAWKVFQQEEKGRKVMTEEGYPLAMWPVCSAAMAKTLAVRDIFTVEQLAKLTAKAYDAIPGDVRDIAQRAKRMVELQKSQGKYEAMIRELESRIAALQADLEEAKETISAQNATMNIMRQKALSNA